DPRGDPRRIPGHNTLARLDDRRVLRRGTSADQRTGKLLPDAERWLCLNAVSLSNKPADPRFPNWKR
ncbi:MAG: hypothetical protein AAF826_13750, partial [Pseudomonadota bacterium]